MAAHPGSFEYLEAKIRRVASGNSYGKDFERICKWFLLNAPQYRGKFRRVYLWHEWPGRWEREDGIDLIAETQEGKLWSIQAKAYAPKYYVKKVDVDSWISASGDPRFSRLLLIATTDHIGPTARRAMRRQGKPTATALRGVLLNSGLAWPLKVSGSTAPSKPWKPEPHQRKAIDDVVAGFARTRRGRLIMACGTGKTLTALWIHEALACRSTIVLAPSIALVQQMLSEWGRHAKNDFDSLVVCSDQSVADEIDPAVRHVADLAMDPTTKVSEIAVFLATKRRRPAVVFATYHSSDRVAAAQKRSRHRFDLIVCDEAHRLARDATTSFTVALDERKLQGTRRLFMTATPVYLTENAKSQAKDCGHDVASMDDEKRFGPEFHVLSFRQAMEAKPEPLLTRYRVVVIGVTSSEISKLVTSRVLVRTRQGIRSDARMLATAIGLAKAMRKYNLRRIITFHRSIKRAHHFVDTSRADSFPRVLGSLPVEGHLAAELWTEHISGEMPAGKRSSLLKALRDLEKGRRGLISNCACLSEGVDVPALDGVAFIDPKRSVVDIVQAVGRVIRKSPDKKQGTIVLPVVIDDGKDAEESLETSAFKVVWQVLKAIRAHDTQFGQVLDQLRTAIGKDRVGEVRLPPEVVFDCSALLPKGFETAFYVRAVKAATERPFEYWLRFCDELCEAHRKTINDIGLRTTFNEAQIGKWLNNQRTAFRERRLSEAQVAALEARGILWNKRVATWGRRLALFRAWCREHGSLASVERATEFQGQRLGKIVDKVRNAYRRKGLSNDKVRELNAIGMVWVPHAASFQSGLEACDKWIAQGNTLLNVGRKTEIDGFAFAKWVQVQRGLFRAGALSKERRQLLEERGMVWEPAVAKEAARREMLRQYVRLHGSLANVKQGDVFQGVKIGVMLNHRRKFYREGTLDPSEIRLLEELGMVWEPLRAERMALIAALEIFKRQHGNFASLTNLKVVDGVKLGAAVARWRARSRQGVLDPSIRKECRRIGLNLEEVKGPGGRAT